MVIAETKRYVLDNGVKVIESPEVSLFARDILQAIKETVDALKESGTISAKLTAGVVESSTNNCFVLKTRAEEFATSRGDQPMANIAVFSPDDNNPMTLARSIQLAKLAQKGKQGEEVARFLSEFNELVHTWPVDVIRRLGFIDESIIINAGEQLEVQHPTKPLKAIVQVAIPYKKYNTLVDSVQISYLF